MNLWWGPSTQDGRVVNTVIMRDGFHERFGIRYRVVLVDYEYSFTYFRSTGESAIQHGAITMLVYLEANYWGVWHHSRATSMGGGQVGDGHLISFLTFDTYDFGVATYNFVIIPVDICVINLDNLPAGVYQSLRDDLNENEMILWIETTILSGENSFSVRIIFEEHDGVEMIFARSANNDAVNLLWDLFIRCGVD